MTKLDDYCNSINDFAKRVDEMKNQLPLQPLFESHDGYKFVFRSDGSLEMNVCEDYRMDEEDVPKFFAWLKEWLG